MSYSGRYKITKPEKYLGDYSNVFYRSLWERQAFKWCESNPRVRTWNSEEVVIPYIASQDKKMHRYFVDLLIEMKNGDTYQVDDGPNHTRAILTEIDNPLEKVNNNDGSYY